MTRAESCPRRQVQGHSLDTRETKPRDSDTLESATIERLSSGALKTESFEVAERAFNRVDRVVQYRDGVNGMRGRAIYGAFEDITMIRRMYGDTLKTHEKIREWKDEQDFRVGSVSPRVADLYSGIMAELTGDEFNADFESTSAKLAEIREIGLFDTLTDPNISWDLKLNNIEKRLDGYVAGMQAMDRRDGYRPESKERTEALKLAPSMPPPRSRESKPGVDAMERLEKGEKVPAMWSIYPPYGGYYSEQVFHTWNEDRKVWEGDEPVYTDVKMVEEVQNEDRKSGKINISISAEVPTNSWVSLPMPYTHELSSVSLVGNGVHHVKQDQNGDLVIYVENKEQTSSSVTVKAAPTDTRKERSGDPSRVKMPEMPATYSDETNKMLDEIRQEKRGGLVKARRLASYARRRIKYLKPKDNAEAERFNNAYRTHPNGFAGAVDELKQADCDVSNTYFAALCAELGVSARHVVGHSVKGTDKRGYAVINSGTGHGWSEVWDEIRYVWVRVDATSPGDPNLDDSPEPESGSAPIPGDFGEQEAIRPTDDALEKLREKLREKKNELSYTREERSLAEATGIEYSEARKIVKEINIAEQTRLPNGELVTDVLAGVFSAIIETRKVLYNEDEGPVSRRDGGVRISHMVRHAIGARAGNLDPESREMPEEHEQEESSIAGFDLMLIGDKSGSMSSTSEGETLWETQRRAGYLILSSLSRFQKNLERSGLMTEDTLDIRTQMISFRGDGEDDLDEDKPLSARLSDEDKVRMWNSLSEQGMANGDVNALSYIYDQINDERSKNSKAGIKDKRLRMIIACSDGMPADPAGVQDMAKKLGEEGTIVVGVGLTETAEAVPDIYNTDYSRGDIAYNIDDLLVIVAKHLVREAIKLFPARAHVIAREIIENTLKKFNTK